MDGVGSGTEVSLGDMVDKLGNVDVDGAGSHATWVLAVETAGSLQRCLLPIIAVAYLVEVGSTH